MPITRLDIEQAAQRIGARVRVTPVITLERGAFGVDAALTLKLESLQHSGSFKPRGAFNRVLAQTQLPGSGLIAASGGNHGAALAYVARELGLHAEIFVPDIISASKLARLHDYGAQVQIVGKVYAQALEASIERAAQTGALQVHAYDQLEVLAGQGTLAREFERQAPDLDTVLVAVGGGGLIGGVATWYGSRIRVIGVEPRNAATLHRALAAGTPVDIDVSGIAADSLGARRAGALSFPIAQQHVAHVVLVEDAAIATAQKELWKTLRCFAEPGGATALAALVSGAYRPARDERVGVVICGGNGDPAIL